MSLFPIIDPQVQQWMNARQELAIWEQQKKDREAHWVAQREKEEKLYTRYIRLGKNETDPIHAVIAKTLPKYVMIQSSQNNLYLRLDEENPNAAKAVRFFGDYSFELDTRFEVVPDTTGNGLIHIRCLHNNKFLANSGTDNIYIAATADKPDPSCTLFQPIFVYRDNNSDLKLRHHNTGLFVEFCYSGGDNGFGFLSLVTGIHYGEVCTFLDWESVVALPEVITIKGRNGNHLKAFDNGYMDYNNQTDGSTAFEFKVFPSRNGGIRLKSVLYDKYWTDPIDSEWVVLKELNADSPHEINTVFIPTRLVDGETNKHRIVMRCLKNGLFCNEHSDNSYGMIMESRLATLNPYADDWSHMDIEEPVISRTVDSVVYGEQRLYDKKTYALVTDETCNRTSRPLTSVFSLKSSVTNTHSWGIGTKVGVGIKMDFTAGVPFVGKSKIGISADITTEFNWGGGDAKTIDIGEVISATIPAKTRVRGTLVVTRFKYEIPFTYSRHDNMKDGRIEVYHNKVGLLTGENGYGYHSSADDTLPLE